MPDICAERNIMKTLRLTFLVASLCAMLPFTSQAQNHSAARKWNNMILEAIRNDYARPTVHARNLYHHSIICYDAWAAFNPAKSTFYLGKTHYGFTIPFDSISIPGNVEQARIEAISYASYRFIQNRYYDSPDYTATLALANQLMNEYGLDPTYTSTDYTNEGAAALGNYLAEQIQLYGLTDGANEANNYANTFYTQMNPPLEMSNPGNPDIQDPNHWQPLSLDVLIDQSGNLITTTQPHLSPEWGNVNPFALDTAAASEISRDGMTFNVYFDTMHPAFLNVGDSSAWDSFYKWNHTLVAIWQSHLDPADGVMWDISPASQGNNTWYPNPTDSSEYALFYDLVNGGDPGTGYTVNPITGQPYTPQMVHRADYARVLAEFWADGIDSETPPGHWFEIYHYVIDQPTFERKWKGVGPVLDPLEYDVKAQLALGGTVHDAAIAAWGLKGYYDYLRPVSAIRYMADQGQSSDTNELNYDPNGIPLMPGLVEVVHIGDTLAGQWNENVGKIKLYTWRGHDYINDPLVDNAGVGWILAEEWWPYQRPTFVTPPFAGFVSGHSTFSRAAAHTMEFITGSAFFPGGMGEFLAPMDEFLVFEDGPSDTVRLQWATYMDASDQCSLSRIWGGIHPPIDDMPGRMIGDVIGPQASLYADSIYTINEAALTFGASTDSLITIADIGSTFDLNFGFSVPMDTSIIPNLTMLTSGLSATAVQQSYYWIDSTELVIVMEALASTTEIWDADIKLNNLVTGMAVTLPDYDFKNLFVVDTKRPLISNHVSNLSILNDSTTAHTLSIDITFDEPCDTSFNPTIQFSGVNYLNPTLTMQTANSDWQNDTTFVAMYDIADFDETVDVITMSVLLGTDAQGNEMDSVGLTANFEIDTKNPTILSAISTETLISQEDLVSPQFNADITFSEAMDTVGTPTLNFMDQGSVYTSLTQNTGQTIWLDEFTLQATFFVYTNTNDLIPLDLEVSNLTDKKGNNMADSIALEVLWSDMKSPEVVDRVANKPIISDSVVGNASYYIDLSFSEAMDTSIVPFVALSAAQPISSDVQFNVPASVFLDSFTYRAYFQIFDLGKEVSPVNLTVNFGKDFAGNPQLVDDFTNFTSLDTKNPTIISLTANDYTLDQWGQSFDVLAVYDEVMRTDIHPVMTFAPTVPVPLPKMDSVWLNGSNYELYYELQGVPSQTSIFDVSLMNAVDLAGNVQNPLSETSFFQLDPLLGIEYLENGQAFIYPTVIGSGGQLTILNLSEENNTYRFDIVNTLGQKVADIGFEKNGNKWISKPVNLSKGMYYLNAPNLQFKVMVK